MPDMDQLRIRYRELAALLKAHGPESVAQLAAFADALRGETDPLRVEDGLTAMQEYAVSVGCLDSPDPEPEPDRPVMALGVEPEPGRFYMIGNVPVLAHRSKESGHVYARRRNARGRWEYAKGAVHAIRENGRLATVEDIAEYNLASGQCFVCGKRLSATKSVAAGIGPKCRERINR